MRADVLQTNFTGGELSPRLYGRPDLAKYADSAKQLRDVVVLQHGGVTRRPGTDDLGSVHAGAVRHRLVPFVFSQADAYILEFGELTMRVWKDGALVLSGGSPLVVVTPWTAAQAWEMDFSQGADTMLVAHADHYPRRLRRYSDTRWVIDRVPFDPEPFGEVGERPAIEVTLSALTGTVTALADADLWLESDVGRQVQYRGGVATITSRSSATQVTMFVGTDFADLTLPPGEWLLAGSPQGTLTPTDSSPEGKITTLAISPPGWRADVVNSFVKINGGLCRITEFTDDTHVQAKIINAMTSTTGAEPGSWSLEGPVWSAEAGYPRAVTLHEQRSVWAGTVTKPQTVWGSRSGLYFDFTTGTADDQSYTFDLYSDEINPINFLSSNRNLLALSYGGEWALSGGVEKPITPTNIRAALQGKVGSANVRPEQVDDDLFFVQRGGKRLRALAWRSDVGGYMPEEASTLSGHLVEPQIECMTYQQSPERVVWLLLSDGTYCAVTVSREQQVRAFTLCAPAGGVVESQATIPEGDRDVTYQIVRRTVGGTTTRRVERMRWDAVFDAQVDRTPVGRVVSGLGHLAGLTVGAVADGVDVGDFTVTAGGQITLPRDASSVSVGLRYTPRVRMLNPEFGTGGGVAIATKKLQGRIAVLFQDTVGCHVNGEPLEFRQFGEGVLDAAVAEFSGWKDVSQVGWSVDASEIELSQPQAYPWTVLAVVRRVTANGG